MIIWHREIAKDMTQRIVAGGFVTRQQLPSIVNLLRRHDRSLCAIVDDSALIGAAPSSVGLAWRRFHAAGNRTGGVQERPL